MSNNSKPLIQVLEGLEPTRRPVWLMRQAGRYLPEYRELRLKAKNFLNLCLTPDWATEITLQPIRRFNFDAAILFADILLIPYALGQKLEFKDGEGPVLECLPNEKSFDSLIYDNEKLLPVYETLRRVKKELPALTSLIGFCGAPWTVACYMIDGNSKSNFSNAKRWAHEKKEALDKLIGILVSASEIYLSQQIEAGAEVVQIFDSWAGLLDAEEFQRFVINPTQKLVRILKAKHPRVSIIGFPREAKEGYHPYIRQTGVDAVSLDYDVSLAYAKHELQTIKPLQGNINPALLVEGGAAMKKALDELMRTLGNKHIINLGHGVVPETPPQNVADFVEHIRNFQG